MRITTSVPRLCLCLAVCLSNLHLILAHEANGQAADGAKVKDMGEVTSQGSPQAIAQGEFQVQAMQQESGQAGGQMAELENKQATTKSKEQDQDGGGAGSKQALAQAKDQAKVQKNNQTMANTKMQAIGQGQNQSTASTQSSAKRPCDPQATNSTKSEGQKGTAQAMAKSQSQPMTQGKDKQKIGHDTKGQMESQGQGKGQTIGTGQALETTGSQSSNQVVNEAEAAVQNLESSSKNNNNQVEPTAAAVAAPPPNNAVMPVAPPPNNAVVQPAASSATRNAQQSTGGHNTNQSTIAQAANEAGANPIVANNSALLSGISLATSSGSGIAMATGMSAATSTGGGSSGGGTCNNCRCNCPMAAFHAAQQVAIMAAMASQLSQSTLQTMPSASAAQASAKTTPQKSLAAPVSGVSGPQSAPSSTMPSTSGSNMAVAQAQPNQLPNVASPQSQGVTAGGAAAALPTNLSTFSFQSAVTVPLGKRQQAMATKALR